MKYKIGDEVLIKFRIRDVIEAYDTYEVEPKKENVIGTFYVDEGLIEQSCVTLEEAWEVAKKVALMPNHGGISGADLNEIFGTTTPSRIFTENTLQEVKEKIEAWEESKNFHVGDIVEKINETDRRRGVVFKVCKKAVLVLHSDLSNRWFEKEEIRKTGETIDIEAFQRQIRGE